MHDTAYKFGASPLTNAPAARQANSLYLTLLFIDCHLARRSLSISLTLRASMGSNSKAAAVFVLALALCGLLAAAAPCNPSSLSPCVGSIMLGGPVTQGCCVRMRAQQGCLCQYARDPSYRAYVNSPRAQGVVSACGIPKPRC
uniref:Uncharacterized protein n=1 Tax=Avena sativa TaxID=4498 RepID=A0ACD6A806_AVESA